MTAVTLRQSDPPRLLVFALDPELVPDAALSDPGALVGRPGMPAEAFELVRLDDISAIGLGAYLLEGHDALPDPSADFEALDDLTGAALVVFSSVARSGDVRLVPKQGVVLAGQFPVASALPPPVSIPAPEHPQILGGGPGGSSTPQRGPGLSLILTVLAGLALILLIGLFLGGMIR